MIKSEEKDKLAIRIKELEEMIEKYSKECINCDNEVITVGKCEKMYEELQKKLLPKSKGPFITPKKK
jgi:hypothetical protein